MELRGVNHRYLELGLRLPDELRAQEGALRERATQRIARGKLDLTLRLRGAAHGAPELRLNEPYLKQLSDLSMHMSARFPDLLVDFSELLRMPGVIDSSEPDQVALTQAVLALLDQALDALLDARQREGARLAQAMFERLDAIAAQVAAVRSVMPEIRTRQRARIDTLLAELRDASEPQRIEKELVAQLLRMDVDEELDRLDVHLAEARRVLALDEPVGRRLDFLLQEFNREANTLGSKSVDVRTSNASIELKVLIEQVREQVQNIE
ncbi:MAG: YicC/YloC family endoribonuclease [Metallibacterium sp.]